MLRKRAGAPARRIVRAGAADGASRSSANSQRCHTCTAVKSRRRRRRKMLRTLLALQPERAGASAHAAMSLPPPRTMHGRLRSTAVQQIFGRSTGRSSARAACSRRCVVCSTSTFEGGYGDVGDGSRCSSGPAEDSGHAQGLVARHEDYVLSSRRVGLRADRPDLVDVRRHHGDGVTNYRSGRRERITHGVRIRQELTQELRGT